MQFQYTFTISIIFPNGKYHEHTDSSENISQYGVNADFTIQRANVNASTWDVYVNGNHYQSTLNHFGYSGSADVQIGEELYGTGRANSPYTQFSYNRWLGTNNGGWNFQGSAKGNIGPNNPPYGN